jgi:hypothetical protein
MKAEKAREIFKKLNTPLTLEEIIERDIYKGYPASCVPRLNENDPQIKKLEKKGYLITHTNTNTYICWTHV